MQGSELAVPGAPSVQGTTVPPPPSATQASPGLRSGTAGASADSPSTTAAASSEGRAEIPSAASPVQIGFPVVADADALNQAAGIAGASQPDHRVIWNALIKDVNSRNGLGGRPITPVFHTYDGGATSDAATSGQRACATYVEDNRVVAALDDGADSFKACMAKAGALMIYDSQAGTMSGEADFRRFPSYVEISMLRVDRMARALTPALTAQGYFAGRPNVGIVAFDIPSVRTAVEKILAPALRDRTGKQVVHWVTMPQDASGMSDFSAAISSAVLRFRSEDVRNVLIVDNAGSMTSFFVQEAQSQQYYPRYGLNSQNAAQTLLSGGAISEQSMADAVGIGWVPRLDLTAYDYSKDTGTANATRARCQQVMKRNAITFADANAEAVALSFCNRLFFLEAVAARGGLSPDGFGPALAEVGEDFPSALTFRTRFGPQQRDGVAGYRYYAFSDTCRCFRYDGPLREL